MAREHSGINDDNLTSCLLFLRKTFKLLTRRFMWNTNEDAAQVVGGGLSVN